VMAAVTHADVIRLVLAHYAGVHIDLFQRLIVSPASVSALAVGDRIPRVLRMNDTGSLGDLVPNPRRRAGSSARASRGENEAIRRASSTRVPGNQGLIG
jgi:broad specificity phosphatase PhoE